MLIKPRPFPINLADAAAAVTIVTGGETFRAATALQRRIQVAFGVEHPVVMADSIDFVHEPATHVVAIGNMANNAFVRAGYHCYQCLTDRAYPGPGGWEVRTIATPWAGSRSMVLCGAGDESGVLRAIERLTEIAVANNGLIGPTIDVHAGTGWEATLAEVDEFESSPIPDEIRFGISDADEIDKSGTYYYLTGREALGRRYREAWLRMARAHPERVAEEQIHLRMCWRVLAWDLLSDMEVFSDADRELIGHYLVEVLDSREGIANAGLQLRSQFNEPRQNHETHVALLLIYGARYLRRAFADVQVDRWEQSGRKIFQVYDHHWKPVEDTFDHAFALTMVDVLDACLCFPDPPFVANGGLRRAADLAMAGCGNCGLSPIIGDSDGQWPRELLAAAGSLYRDGRYAWMAQRGRPTREFNPRLQRRWADDVAPWAPDDLIGLQVQPLDKLYYDLPAVNPDYAMQFYISSPNVAHGQTFDKLTLRSGLDLDSQYILMDGVAGGSHSFDDTNAIHAFDQYGKSWIVPEDNLHWPQQTHHSLVSIVRDGESERIPTFAELRHATGLRESAFVLSAVRAYAGADWQRGLVWRRGDYLLVLDEIEAIEPGNYTIETRYRTLGDHHFTDGAFSVAQDEARFHIGWDGAQHAWGEPVDVSIAYLWDPQLVEDRKRRYGGIWPLVLTMLHLSAEHDLLTGERAAIASVLHAGSDFSALRWNVQRLGRMGARLQRGDEVEYAATPPDGGFCEAGIDFTGEAFRIGVQTLSLASATHLSLGGRQILTASQSVDIELDTASQTALLRLAQPANVQLLHETILTAAGIPLDKAKSIPAGEHVIKGMRWGEFDFLAGISTPAPQAVIPARSTTPQAAVAPVRTVAQPTCFVILKEGRIAVGGAAGEVALTDLATGPVWRTSIPGEVLTIACGDLDGDGSDDIVAGGTGCAIHALRYDGSPLWVTQPEFGSQYWVWWTLNESQIHRLVVDDIDGNGVPEVLAGVSNMRLHCYDASGHERWTFRTDHGIFKTFVTQDVDSDGKKEIVGGCDLLSATSVVRIVGADGELRDNLWNQGWTAQVRSLLVADIDGDGKLEVCCGTNRDDCLRVHWADGSGLRWSHNLGDTVTGIGVLRRGDDSLLIAGSRSFYISAFAPDSGKTRWVTNIHHAVTTLLTVNNHVIAGSENGRVVILDFDGHIQSDTQLAGPIAQLAISGNDLLAMGRNEGVWRVSMG